jgi:hypothetical protein
MIFVQQHFQIEPLQMHYQIEIINTVGTVLTQRRMSKRYFCRLVCIMCPVKNETQYEWPMPGDFYINTKFC